ncbi:hypothetical protein A3K86_19810 [Photobacterium jeanii]|uniref:Acyltransferase 3 domain-containing protein n=1 Tax=Photobacterium jeanii TaxID=858640 RepID=A0A178K276_9GAMM|nr:acyltransferase [Photobacterium jeanii]OAN11206.1 hypothetical protein A3K86_19810 [Photobacterium jeanii]PST90726.1 acyltransferase [Photobacterium jeanii]
MQRQLPLLTAIRGFAAFIVALFHARLVLYPQWREEIASYSLFLENAYLWVDIFFILSGFVMMHVYRQQFQAGCTGSKWRQFMWLRFSRIYPLFIATLLVMVGWETFKHFNSIGFYGGSLLDSWGLTGLPAFKGPFNTSETLFANVILLQGITGQPLSWNFPGWSLSIEWLCYMLFPIVMALLAFNAKRSLWLPPFVFLLLYGLISTTGKIDLTSGIPAFLRGLCGFSLGAWLCLIKLPPKAKQWINQDWLLFAVVIALLVLMHHKLAMAQILTVYLLFALLVFLGANQSDRPSVFLRLFDNKLTRYLGDISYSVYLWHSVLLLVGVEVINYLSPHTTMIWYLQTRTTALATSLIVFSAILIAVSSLSYHWLEKPALRRLRALFPTTTKKQPLTTTENV